VFPGDMIVGDDEAVVVIPAELASDIADEAFEMTAFEDFASEQILDGRSIIGLYPPTNVSVVAEFQRWREAKGW
jgi:regulator of RNase E activity RraA